MYNKVFPVKTKDWILNLKKNNSNNTKILCLVSEKLKEEKSEIETLLIIICVALGPKM